MTKAVQKAYDYLMDENPIDLHQTLEYLNSQNVSASESEVMAIAEMIDDIRTELYMVRSLKLMWDVKRFNRLAYGL